MSSRVSSSKVSRALNSSIRNAKISILSLMWAVCNALKVLQEFSELITILAFLDNIGYTAADNIGVNRVQYPDTIHIIKVISVNRVMPKHIIYALENGADGIFIGEYPGDLMYSEVERKMNNIRNDILDHNMDPERLQFARVYIPYFRGLANQFKEFDEELRLNSY